MASVQQTRRRLPAGKVTSGTAWRGNSTSKIRARIASAIGGSLAHKRKRVSPAVFGALLMHDSHRDTSGYAMWPERSFGKPAPYIRQEVDRALARHDHRARKAKAQPEAVLEKPARKIGRRPGASEVRVRETYARRRGAATIVNTA